MEAFEEAVRASRHPVCYNGNLFSAEDYERFTGRFPEIQSVMLGRGLIANPGLVRELQGEKHLSREDLQKFHSTVYNAYKRTRLGEVNTLFKMKELWAYMGQMFAEDERSVKKIRKAKSDSEYVTAVQNLFASCEMNGIYRG